MPLLIRRGVASDAAAACLTVRRSIIDLCTEDHCGDEATLSDWLANKTESNFASWINSDKHITVVAEDDATMVGVALLSHTGEVALLYVLPEARLRGVSKALLAALEHAATRLGISELTLKSTSTAQRFYSRCGFMPAGEPTKGFGLTLCFPMSKRLHSNA